MAAVSVGLITNDDTTPYSSSSAFKTALETYMTSTHTYSVTYYEPSQIATAVSTEDILVVDLIGLNADGGDGSYDDASAAFDGGLPCAAFGRAGAGDTQYPPLIASGAASQYQGTGGCHVPSSLDSEGILTAAGFSANDDFDATNDGDVSYLTGTLAGGLEILVETDTGDYPACAILPAGGAKVGGGTVTNSIAYLCPEEAGSPALDAFNLTDAILDYLYQESVGGGATAPGAPTGLTATKDGSSAIDLSWTAPASDGGSSITGYKIEREVGVGNGWSDLVADTSSTSTTYEDSSVDPGQEYNYRVSAINAVGTGSASTADSATTDATAPGAPTGLTATANGHDQIDLSWSAPASTGGAAITGYKIERESPTGNGFSDLVADTSSTDTTYSDTSLDPETEYNYRVSAINSAGTGSASTADDATTGSAPVTIASDMTQGTMRGAHRGIMRGAS